MADRRRNAEHWRPSLIDRFRARAREIEQERGAAVTTDEVAAIYSELLESMRTESKHTITELSKVAAQQLRHAEGILKDPSQYARLPSTPGKNSLFQYGGKEGSTSQSRAPSQTPRVGLISFSPPGERFHFLNFLESVVDKASQPRFGHRFGFGTSIDQNDGSAKSSSSNDVKQGPRLLIDAFRGNDTSHEKLPKVQRLHAYQGMTNLQCNEEDMYAWKNMSPILAIQGKELKLGPPRPNVGSNRQNAALPEKEFKTSRPSQTFLPRPDICANAIEDATPNLHLGSSIGVTQVHKSPYTNRQCLYLSEQTSLPVGFQLEVLEAGTIFSPAE